jgi:hypothetical protein
MTNEIADPIRTLVSLVTNGLIRNELELAGPQIANLDACPREALFPGRKGRDDQQCRLSFKAMFSNYCGILGYPDAKLVF